MVQYQVGTGIVLQVVVQVVLSTFEAHNEFALADQLVVVDNRSALTQRCLAPKAWCVGNERPRVSHQPFPLLSTLSTMREVAEDWQRDGGAHGEDG